MVTKKEDLVGLCELNDDGDIVFTREYLRLMKGFNGGPRRFAVMLIDQFKTEHSNLLDYFGEDDSEVDRYTGLDTDPFDVRNDIPELCAFKNPAQVKGLDSDWYRDLFRAKLLSIKLPRRLIQEYVKAAMKE